MQHGVSAFHQVPLVRYLLEQLNYFCKKPPKGFEKYFEEGKSSKTVPTATKETSNTGKENVPPSKTARNDPQTSEKKEWNFGMFANTNKQQGSGGKGSQGRPIGDGGDGFREKWLVIGAVGAVALLGSFAFFEMGYKEISWKEFVTKYAKNVIHVSKL